ncbi:MAG: hypothetical protein AMXMBFR64_07960 [Myxococcales bacterium]
MPTLRIEDVRYGSFGPVTLTVGPAECVCLRGASGSGKSRLLRALADLDPHEGAVSLDGALASAMPPPLWRRQVGLLPADSHWWNDTVGEHLPDTALLLQVGFGDDVLSWRVDRLSSGERQRLALVRLLAGQPRALLLDEPTANLDPASARDVEALIARWRLQHEAPVLWVTHDDAQAARVADRRFVLEGGVLVPDSS